MSSSSPDRNIYFLTFSYYPSGIFVSQIFDVIKLLRELSGKNVKLISFFSVRNYFACRKWVKSYMPDAIVLPIIFGMKRWNLHHKLISLFIKKNDWIIGRNPMGAAIALGFSKNVIYDGRSALKGEISEYDMAMNASLNQSLIAAEEMAVHHSKLRLSVSHELINFWKDDLNYHGNEHFVIPCSLGYSHSRPLENRPANDRTQLIFSGGGSPWQSQEEKFEWITQLLDESDYDLTFLSKNNASIEKLSSRFPTRVTQRFVSPERVFDELCKADYGILLREDNLTNRVAAPVKFAEYLNAGLKVIISSSVRDYANFTRQHACGVVLDDLNSNIDLSPLTPDERVKNRKLADEHFSKHSKKIRSMYQKVIDHINEQ